MLQLQSTTRPRLVCLSQQARGTSKYLRSAKFTYKHYRIEKLQETQSRTHVPEEDRDAEPRTPKPSLPLPLPKIPTATGSEHCTIPCLPKAAAASSPQTK